MDVRYKGREGAFLPSFSFSYCVVPNNYRVFEISASARSPIQEPTYGFDAKQTSPSIPIQLDRIRKQLLSPRAYTTEQRGVYSL